jgi:pimeloyl-ACP methyl ester carboxylesterase
MNGVPVKVNGRELAIEVDGQGPAVLMVHGLGSTSNFYQVQADALAGRFQVIRVDSAGAGRSPVADGITIESHADDLAAVLDALGVDSAAVVGRLGHGVPGRYLALAVGDVDARQSPNTGYCRAVSRHPGKQGANIGIVGH